MRFASVQGQGLASAAGVGREPNSGALARPSGRVAAGGGASREPGSADAAEVEVAGRRQVPQVNSGHFLLCRTVAHA